jgi:hypothetical protein
MYVAVLNDPNFLVESRIRHDGLFHMSGGNKFGFEWFYIRCCFESNIQALASISWSSLLLKAQPMHGWQVNAQSMA